MVTDVGSTPLAPNSSRHLSSNWEEKQRLILWSVCEKRAYETDGRLDLVSCPWMHMRSRSISLWWELRLFPSRW
jgi:hypothetical protein